MQGVRQSTSNKLLSILLAVVFSFGMIPQISLPAYADDSDVAQTSVTKVWRDEQGREISWPSGVSQVHVEASYVRENGTKIGSETLTLTKNNHENVKTRSYTKVSGARFKVEEIEESALSDYISHVVEWGEDGEEGFYVINDKMPVYPDGLKPEVVVSATKTLDGMAVPSAYNGAFEFELNSTNGPVPRNNKAKNNGSTVEFSGFDFTGNTAPREGKFDYTIRELQGSDENIIYDTRVRNFSVDVSRLTWRVNGAEKSAYVLTDIEGGDGVTARIVFGEGKKPTVPETAIVTDNIWNWGELQVDDRGNQHSTGTFTLTGGGQSFPALCLDFSKRYPNEQKSYSPYHQYSLYHDGSIENYGRLTDAQIQYIKDLAIYGFPYDITGRFRKYVQETFPNYSTIQRERILSYAANVLLWRVTNPNGNIPYYSSNSTSAIGKLINDMDRLIKSTNRPYDEEVKNLEVNAEVYRPVSTYNAYQPMVIFTVTPPRIEVKTSFDNTRKVVPKGNLSVKKVKKGAGSEADNEKFNFEISIPGVEGDFDAEGAGYEIVKVFRTEEIGHDQMARLTLLSTPSPVLALVRKKEPGGDDTPRGLCLALDSIRDPGNMGTIMRICDWFGVSTLYLSPDCVDIYNPKVVQATMGAIFRLRTVSMDIPALCRRVASLGGHVYGERFSAETAIQLAPQVMYFAECMRRGMPFVRPDAKNLSLTIAKPELRCFKVLRIVNPMAYAYVTQLDELLISIGGADAGNKPQRGDKHLKS